MDSDDQGLPTPGAALLLIIGEPFTDDHKSLILEEITKGFRCWDVEDTGVDINEELSQIASRAALGEEGANGERLIQHQSENLSVEILINPVTQSVKSALRKLLIVSSPTKYLIYAGHSFQDTGAWVLQDDIFSFNSFAQVFKNVDVETALKQNIEANLTIHTQVESHWGTSISKADFTNNLRIQLNPPEKLENISGVVQFTAYVGIFVTQTPVTKLLQASEQFGNISFTRPTLYIFPGCQGDSALFGINGFNLLVNGGYNRRSCFWDFARHLDRVDAMLLTHLGQDNIFGISTALQRKSIDNIHPQIGYLFFNALDKPDTLSEEAVDGNEKKSSLIFSLAEEANDLTKMAKQLGINPQSCSRSDKIQNAEPINLYHKLGSGSLDMYVLNPMTDSKEIKEFYQNWSKKSSNLGSSGPFPLSNALSACIMLVWKPHNPTEKIVRILFPGNAPQHKIAEGLEKMKNFAYLKHASCTEKDLQKPVAVKKAGSSQRPGSGTARSARSATSRTEVIKTTRTIKVESPKSPRKTDSKPTTRSSPLKTSKVREETKRTAEVRNRPTKLEDKENSNSRPSSARSTTASSAAKTASPRKSPTKSPSSKALSPSKSPSPPKSSPTKAKSPEKAKVPEKGKSQENGKSEKTNSSENLAVNSKDNNSVANGGLKDVAEDHQNVKQDTEKLQDTQPSVIAAEKEAQNSTETKTLNGSSVDALNSPLKSEKEKLENMGIYDHQNITGETEQSQIYANGEAEEEIKPQALPDPPVILESPSQDSDIIPDYSSKIKSDQQELSDFNKAEEELHDIADTPGKSLVKSFEDPAEGIPPSPEPTIDEQTDFNDVYPVNSDSSKSFETPVFTNDGPDVDTNGLATKEQKIQYGIDESSRAMAGIQEEDEPEEDLEVSKELSDAIAEADKNFGISNDTNTVKDKEEVKENKSCDSESHIEDVISGNNDEGIEVDEDKDLCDEDESSVPAAFDRDSSPEMEVNRRVATKSVAESTAMPSRDYGDSMNRNGHDVDKDIDESIEPPNKHHIIGDTHNGVAFLADTNDQNVNPFIGINKDENNYNKSCAQVNDEPQEQRGASFDPVAEWGQPMGLPSPPPPSSSSKSSDRRPTSATNSKNPSTADTKSRTARNSTTTTDRKRPATAPARSGMNARPTSGAKRTGPGSSRTSPQSAKIPPMPPMTAYYMDLTYIPNHGDLLYSDVEFFKRIRARYYVLSALTPNSQILDALMEAKATWEQKDLEVTLIPTYDNETLRHWVGLNKEKLQELRIDLTPAVSRCTIQLQDLETSLPAYRLEV